jgi:DNA-binding NtrC family response regulator
MIRMKRDRALLSWIGVTDHEHFLGKKPGSPLVSVALSARPTSIDLLWGAAQKTPLDSADNYQEWLKQQLRTAVPNVRIEIHRIPESSDRVMDFGWVYGNVERCVPRFDDSVEVCVNASSGTSMMTAAWIVWAKTLAHTEATLYISSPERGAQQLELPPGLEISLHRLVTIREDDLLLDRLLAGWSPPSGLNEVQGSSRAMRSLLYRVEQVARFPVPVLFRGEPGTGKSILARLMHGLRTGKEAGFVVVDCGQLFGPTEIHNVFGWKKGAFTGAAANNAGIVADAHEGTLFFDEVGNAPTEIQANLLRLLQERKYRVLGGDEVNCTARIVAATNASLSELIRAGRFRQDLLDRLSGVTINIPPLRERDGDVIEIAQKKLDTFQEDVNNRKAMEAAGIVQKHLKRDAERELRAYDWPGNVRELEHLIARLVIFGEPTRRDITGTDVRRQLEERTSCSAQNPLGCEIGGQFRLDDIVLNVQEYYVKAASRRARGNKTEMARLLGFGQSRTPLNTILRRMKNAGRAFESNEP